MRATCFPCVLLIGLLLTVCLPRQTSAQARPRVALAGIFKTGDGPLRRSGAIEAEVARRLRSLGLVVVRVPPTAGEVCQEADCLPEITGKVGTDLALTGVVYRTAELCTANLWVYDARSTVGHSADIHCQAETMEESLGPEFADQAGRFIEPAYESPISKIAALQLVGPPGVLAISTGDHEVRTSLRRPLWPWDQKRKVVVFGIGLSLAGLLGSSIAVSTLASRISTADGTANPLNPAMMTLWSVTAVNVAAFSVTLAIPAIRK